MDELNNRLNDEFFVNAKGTGDVPKISPEDLIIMKQEMSKFNNNKSNFELYIQKEQFRASLMPETYITF